jgi:hypothetical protein
MWVSAYPYPDYGTLKGGVRGITADAITPQSNSNSQAAPYYEVTVEPEKLDYKKAINYIIFNQGWKLRQILFPKKRLGLTHRDGITSLRAQR